MRFLGFSGKGFWLKRLVSEDRGEIEENREKLKKDRRAIYFVFTHLLIFSLNFSSSSASLFHSLLL